MEITPEYLTYMEQLKCLLGQHATKLAKMTSGQLRFIILTLQSWQYTEFVCVCNLIIYLHYGVFRLI